MGSRQRAFDPARARIRGSAGRKRRAWIWVAAALGILAVIGLAAGTIWTVKRGSDRPPAVSGQPVPELSGRQAPGFVLLSATGAPTNFTSYTFTPGDGKRHLFVFFMGYF